MTTDYSSSSSAGSTGTGKSQLGRGSSSIYLHYAKLSSYVLLWYLFTVSYNVTNKVVLSELDLPVTVASVQICIGVLVFAPIWIFGKRPASEPRAWYARYHRVAWMHGLGNVASVCAFATGAVPFVHVCKAAEPLFAAFFAYKMLVGFTVTRDMLISLALIIIGVSMSSLAEVTFRWSTLCWALAANALYQARIVMAKKEMQTGSGQERSGIPLTVVNTSSIGDKDDTARSVRETHGGADGSIPPATLFRIITLLASWQLVPLALLTEGWKMQPVWQAAVASGVSTDYLVFNLILSGTFYYLYNEVAFWVLEMVSPVSHAVGNSLKRVVVIFASMILLNTETNAQAVLGGLLAVCGALMYALVSKK